MTTKEETNSADPPLVTGVPVQEESIVVYAPSPQQQQQHQPPPFAPLGMEQAPPSLQASAPMAATAVVASNTFIAHPPTVIFGHLGRNASTITCPYCQQQVVTRTVDQIDGLTVLFMVVILFVFWPLFWLPLCMPSCKSTSHYCGKCHRRIGKTDPCQ